MIEIMICGAGNIGSAVACLLSTGAEYNIHLADIDFSAGMVDSLLNTQKNIKTVALDVRDESSTMQYVAEHSIKAIVSCLPSELNPSIALVAKEMHLDYFDLGENETILKNIQEIAKDSETAFVPNCGLAPGIVGVIANALVASFEHCHSAHMRVGTLLLEPKTAFDCAPDCSVDRIINQYTNPCTVIDEGCVKALPALMGLESFDFESQTFEAFYTSGCMGGLPGLLSDKLQQLDYKSIHFPGYNDKFNFLLHDLKLKHKPDALKSILHDAKATTQIDQVLLYVNAKGRSDGKTTERSFQKRLSATTINGVGLSATQASTAAGVCAVIDYVLSCPQEYRGLIVQENLCAKTILSNRFAAYYDAVLDF